eukprot:9464757-Pyramimonas_sp.AAC.1
MAKTSSATHSRHPASVCGRASAAPPSSIFSKIWLRHSISPFCPLALAAAPTASIRRKHQCKNSPLA